MGAFVRASGPVDGMRFEALGKRFWVEVLRALGLGFIGFRGLGFKGLRVWGFGCRGWSAIPRNKVPGENSAVLEPDRCRLFSIYSHMCI